MKLERIEINNFMSIGDLSVNLEHKDQLLISGDNGAGKSSLFEAVYWCFTNQTVRGVKAAEVVRQGEKDCKVRVNFRYDGYDFSVENYWSKTKKIFTIRRNDEVFDFHSVTEGVKYLLDYLNVTKEDLSLICFFGRKFETFSQYKPAARAQLLDKIVGGDQWLQASKYCQSKSKEVRNKIEWSDQSLQRQEEDISNLEKEINNLEKEINNLEKERDEELKESEKVLKVYEREYSNLEKEISNLEKERSSKEDVIKGLREQDAEVRAKVNSTANLIKDLYHHMRDVRAQLDNGKCLSCGQDLSKGTHSYDRVVGELESLEKSIGKQENIRLRGKEKLGKINSSLEDFLSEEHQLGKEQKEKEAKLVSIKKRVDTFKEEISDLKSDKVIIEKRAKLTALNEDVLRDKLSQVDQLLNEIDELEKQKGIYDFWVKGFKSIRFSLLQEAADILQYYISNYIKLIGIDSDGVKISSFTETGRPEINLSLVRGDHLLPIEALSEGETKCVDLACFFAIRNIMQSYGKYFDFVVMDEPLGGLDQKKTQNVFGLISSFDDVQRFVIEHDPVFQELFTDRLNLIKSEGITCML